MNSPIQERGLYLKEFRYMLVMSFRCSGIHSFQSSNFVPSHFSSFLYTWQLASGRPTLNLERSLDHDGHPLAIAAADVAASGVPPWNWRETPGNGKLCKGLVCHCFL